MCVYVVCISSKRSEQKLWETVPPGVFTCVQRQLYHSIPTAFLPTNKVTPSPFPLCVQASALRVRVPAACGGPEVSTDLPLRGKTPRGAAPSLSLRAPLEELRRVAFPLKGGLTLAHSIQEV